GRGWRSVIDGLRPHTQRLWRELSLEDRKRFLRHLRPWWDVHRHRSAPQVMARIAAAREAGQLRITAGRVLSTETVEGGVSLEVQLRAADTPIVLEGVRLIDCTGLNSDCTKVDQPLLKQMLGAGLIRADALRLGLDIAEDGALIDRDGNSADD